jgi:elongator complex protein 3
MKKLLATIIKEAILRKCKSPEDFEKLKKEISKRFKTATPRNADIKRFGLEEFRELHSRKEKAEPWKNFEKILKSKKVRTFSGVAVVAVLTKPYPCRGKCLYCPTEAEIPKSYLSNEPAVMRAVSVKFNPYQQVQKRLRALEINGHDTSKIELIIMGGTFSDLPRKYQYWFVKECYRAANDYPTSRLGNSVSKLTKEQKRNEKAKHRIVGLTLETRPDTLDGKEIESYRELGCTRVEIGVQSIYDDVLEKNRRGHSVEQTVKATKLLKDAGFKVSYHLMLGLWGSNFKKDIEMFQIIFSDSRFQPDLVKIYPCVVTQNSALYNLWKKKKYKPLTNQQTEKLIIAIKKIIPPYVRISRLIRDIPDTSIVAGPNISNLRQIIQNKGINCQCIRCREVRGSYTNQEKITLRRIDYDASDGKEIFLEYCSPDYKKLYSMLRLRITSSFRRPTSKKNKRLSLGISERTAIIREVHTYGKLVPIGAREKKSPQHAGLGKKLIKRTEQIAKEEFGCQKIAVIAGIGVREYYRKLGYRLQDTYMVKKL